MTWHLMSSRPSSNTAKRPAGPAPTMTTSVSIAASLSWFMSKILNHLSAAIPPAARGVGFGEVRGATGGGLARADGRPAGSIIRRLSCSSIVFVARCNPNPQRHPAARLQPCWAGVFTTSPSSSGRTVIWQHSRELGFTSKAKSSMSSSIWEGLPVFSVHFSST